MSEPELFWLAVGSIAQVFQAVFILVSGIVILLQVRQIRKELIEKDITSLRQALDIIDTDLFNQASRQSKQGITIQGFKWHQLLESLDLIEFLISQKYTDETILFKFKGEELAHIARYLSGNQMAENLKAELVDQHSDAIRLLKRALAFSMKQRRYKQKQKWTQ